MVGPHLTLLRWKIESRAWLEGVWENRWSGIALTSCGAVVCAFLVWRIPAPGVSVAVMGVGAALMTARTKASGAEKAVWMLIITSSLVIEVLAIRKDRHEHDESLATLLAEEVGARKDAKTNFGEIGAGIQATIERSDEHFEATMDRSSRIMAGIGDAIRTETGGDSFAFITLAPQPNQQFLVTITSHGKYPLREIRITMMDEERRVLAMQEYNKHPEGDWIKAIQAGDTSFSVPYLRPQGPEAPTGDVQVLGAYPFGIKDTNDLTIAFSSHNGYWNERLHLRRLNGRWLQAVTVIGPTAKSVQHPFEYYEADFPDGKGIARRDWPLSKSSPQKTRK
jgi:hypothetical protein